MISTGAFLNEMDASNKQPTVAEKFAAVWEKKNAKAARAGGVSLMALSLAACGSSSDDPAPDQPEVITGDRVLTNGTDAGGIFDASTSTTAVNFVAGAVYTPGGNDRINSLQDEDVIVGGAGDDTINISVTTANDNGNVTITPTITDVENINIAFNSSNDASEIDMQDVNLVGDIDVSRISSATVTLDNIQRDIDTLSLANTHEDNTTINVQFDDNVLEATNNQLVLTVDDVEAATIDIAGEDGTGFETITMDVKSGGITAADLVIDDTQTLTVLGTGDVTVSDLGNSAQALATIDASSHSGGDVSFNLGAANVVEAVVTATSGTSINFHYDGSQGNDTILLDNASLALGQTAGDDAVTALAGRYDFIDGGAGTNNIDFTVAASADLVHNDNHVDNVQSVRIDVTTAAQTATLDVQQFDGLTAEDDIDLQTIVVRNDGATGVANFDIVDSRGSETIQVQHASVNADSTTTANTDVEIDLLSAAGTLALGTGESQTVEIISGTNTAESFNFTLDVDGKSAAGVANGGGVETLQIIDSDNEDNTVIVSSIAEHTTLIDLDGGRADDAFVLSGTAVAVTVDATGQSSDTTVTVGTADQTVLMGSGDDTTIVAGANNLNDSDVSFHGGTGDDILMAGYEDQTAADIDDLDVSNYETFAVVSSTNGGTIIEFDNTEEEAVTTLRLLGSVHDDTATLGVTAGNVAVTDLITIEADTISTVQYRGDTGAGTDVFNAATLDGMNSTNTSMAISIDSLGTGGGATAGVLTASETETATITHADVTAFTMSSLTMTSLTSLTVTNGSTVTDNGNLTLTAVSTGAMTTMDASGMDGNFVAGAFVNVANDATFDGGAGDDTISIAGSLGTGVTINGGAGADTITGNSVANTINAGAGADQITGGGGQDVINLGTDTDADDVFLTTTASYDIISGFDTAEDDVNVGGTIVAALAGTTAATSGGVAAGALTDNTAYVISDGATALTGAGAQAIADYMDMTDVAAYLAEGYTSTAADDEAVFAINDLVGGRTFLYHFLEASGGASTISAGELSVIAIITEESGAALVAGDVI